MRSSNEIPPHIHDEILANAQLEIATAHRPNLLVIQNQLAVDSLNQRPL